MLPLTGLLECFQLGRSVQPSME